MLVTLVLGLAVALASPLWVWFADESDAVVLELVLATLAVNAPSE